MQGIGPGTILSGRYTAEHRTAAYPGAEQWIARDATLDRAVLLLVVRREHPNVDAVLDAARRSAGLDNVRLSRILDVGTDGEVSYVVEESLDGSHTISELLAAGPLPAPEVRRVVGETSLVLDVARHRGLHHQRLTPDLVLRTPDGDVKVRGLATMAALAGVDDVSDQEASRTDAIAVVALAYAGFTGTWPLPGASGGLPPAPRVANHVAAPSELVPGVPADLDALCRLTFANNQGPTTPGDFARQIAPWSPIPVMLPTISPQNPRHESPADTPLDAASFDAARRGQDQARHGDRPREKGRAPGGSRDDDQRGAEIREDDTPEATGRDRDHDTVRQPVMSDSDPTLDPDAQPRPSPRPQRRPGDPGTPTVKGPVPVAHRIPSPTAVQPQPGNRDHEPAPSPRPPMRTGGAPAAARGAGAPSNSRPGDSIQGRSPRAPVQPGTSLGPSPVATTAAKTAAALGAAGAATASAARSLSDRFSGWSSDTRDRARLKVEELKERRDEAAAQRAAEAEARAAREGELEEDYDESETYASDADGYAGDRAFGTKRGALARDRDEYRLEPPVPLLPPSAADPLTRDQSRLAIGIIVGFLVLALAFAVWGLSKLPSSLPTLSSSDGSTSISTPTPEGEAGETATGEQDAQDGPAAAAPGQPLEFSGAVDYDPQGDGQERPEELAFIFDGDDATFWGSEGYRGSTFGGLKQGVGVILDLGAESTVSAVDLVLPSAASGELYLTSDEAFVANRPMLTEEMQPAGTFSGEGAVTSELVDGARGRYVVVWFTEISQQGDWYRARLAGASATS